MITTRADLLDETGLSPTQLTTVLRELKHKGLIDEKGARLDGQRPIHLAGSAGVLIGVDVNLHRATVAVAEMDYKRLNDPARASVPIQINDAEATLASIAKLIVSESRDAGVEAAPLIGVALALPGPIGRLSGIPSSPQFLPGWSGIAVPQRLKALLSQEGFPDTPVVATNDASIGALGVYTRARLLDAAKAPDDLVYVRVDSGVGAGVVIKGRLITGAEGFAGEIGHIRTEPDGPVCTRCAQRGCLETFASADAVLERVRRRARDDGRPAPRTLSDAIRLPDAVATEEVTRGGWHLGLVLAGVANFLNPSWIVLGGEIAETDWFFNGTTSSLHRFALKPAADRLEMLTWGSMTDALEPMCGPRLGDPGEDFSAELLGALAFVVDELAEQTLLSRATA